MLSHPPSLRKAPNFNCWRTFATCLLTLLLVSLPTLSFAEESDEAPTAETAEAERTGPMGLIDSLDDAIAQVNGVVGSALFFDISFGAFEVADEKNGAAVIDEQGQPVMRPVPVPFLVAFLGFGGVLFTLLYRFVNLRGFGHAIAVVRGKYDKAENERTEGEVSHFQALTSALSATVGLGNIAGVAIAIQKGGPGAVFWMVIAAFFGMSVKFSSCTLAQLYRQKNKDGSLSGGPMYYLDLGLKERGLAPFGKVLAVIFAFMIMGGAMGGGNMFQANQSFGAIKNAFDLPQSYAPIFGIIMAILVGLVILGGIKRIGAATEKIVPAMVAIYVLASLTVLFANFSAIPDAFALIFERAFSKNALFGGAVGVLIMGVQRASFSNEAGLGSSAIAHAAAKTSEPVREGLVAMLEPFIDTMVVCTMTALVVIVSGAWQDPDMVAQPGVALTNSAFATVLPWFPKVLAICVILFAYSTMISWCYYGERGWIYLLDHFNLGLKTLPVFRAVFVLFVFIGSVANLGSVLDFSDLLILCMALPNILGSIFLFPVLRDKMADYFKRMAAE